MSTTSETPDKSEKYVNEPWSKYLLRTAKNVVKVVAGLVAFGIAISIAGAGYDQLDVNGYISHDRTLDVYMTNNWLVGENRDCWLGIQFAANGHPSGKLDSLQCPVEFDKLEPHNVTVTFKGVVDPYDMDGKVRTVPSEWKCTRHGDGFTCEPTTTSVKPTN